jgi:hypothetical protein
MLFAPVAGYLLKVILPEAVPRIPEVVHIEEVFEVAESAGPMNRGNEVIA